MTFIAGCALILFGVMIVGSATELPGTRRLGWITIAFGVVLILTEFFMRNSL